MRHWACAHALTAANANLAARFGVAPLPSGSGSTGDGALGGWMLDVSSHGDYSDVAADFVPYATSSAEEIHVATDGGYLPSRPDVHNDSRIQAAQSFHATAKAALARPSGLHGQVPTAVYARAHSALTGAATSSQALTTLESDLVSIMSFATGLP